MCRDGCLNEDCGVLSGCLYGLGACFSYLISKKHHGCIEVLDVDGVILLIFLGAYGLVNYYFLEIFEVKAQLANLRVGRMLGLLLRGISGD